MITYPNAKINLGLNVVKRRQDGYHNIETIFYPIGLYDELNVSPSNARYDYYFSSEGIKISGNPEKNLIIKALRLVKEQYPIPPIDIFLDKKIPFGAGLGGGSSNAAFMLKSLNELFNLNIPTEKLEKMAAKIGADCPFFIENKPVFATGIGNVFAPVDLTLQSYWLLLVKPDIHVSTPEAYAGVTPAAAKTVLTELIKNPIEDWKNNIFNDFEKSVFTKYPVIGELKKQMYGLGALYASMSGSGSSVYGIFGVKPESEELKRKYKHVFTIKL
jgi:4-diphosphocytidyl-2-C-methyl-D-erythritol kinase